MAYTHQLLGSLYFLRWLSTPTEADFARQLHELGEAYREQKTPLTYLSITPDTIDAPQGDARIALERFAGNAASYCSTVHLVLEGTGFRGTIIRSVVTAVIMARRQHKLVKIHASLDSAQRSINHIKIPSLLEINKHWGISAA